MNTVTGQYARLLQERWERVNKGECGAVFFNVHDHDLFSSFLDRLLPSLQIEGSGQTILRLCRDDALQGPYAPLLDWTVKRIWRKTKTLDGYLEACGIYPPQIPSFRAYLEKGRAQRYEEVIHEELPYERVQAIRSVWNLLFSVLSDGPVLIILENLTRIPSGTIHALIDLFHNPEGRRVLLITSHDDQDPSMDEYRLSLYRKLMDTANSRMLHAPRKGSELRHPQKTRQQQYSIEDGKDAFYLLALEDARYILKGWYKEHISGNKSLSPEEEMELIHFLGDTHLYLNEIDDALLAYQNLITLAREQKNRKITSGGYRRLGMAHLLKDDVIQALKMGGQALLLAEKEGDAILILEAKLLLFNIEDKKRKQSIDAWREINDDLVDRVQELGWKNTLCYIYSNQYGTFSRYSEKYRKQHEDGIMLAKKLKNQFRLAASYQIKGLIASVQGEYDEVIRYYKKSEAIKAKMGNALELAYIRNGIGFYHYMIGEYENAFADFTTAITHLVKVKEFHEIGMTWFNIAATSFLSFDHENAILHLEATLSILSLLEMPNLSYHSRFGIYVLLGTAYCKAGDPDRGYEYLTRIRIEGLKPYPQKNEEFFFYCLLRALLFSHEEDHRRAERFFSKAEDYLYRTNDIISYFEPRFRYERALAAHQRSDKKCATDEWQKGRTASETHKNPFYTLLFGKSFLKSQQPSVRYQPEIENSFDSILEKCHTERKLTQLHYRINEISFLNSFQNAMVEQSADPPDLISRAAFLIRASFPIEGIIHHSLENGQWVHTGAYPPPPTDNKNSFADLIPFLIEKDQPFYPGGIPSITETNPVVSLPLLYKGTLRGHLLCFCNTNSSQLEAEGVRVLITASSQLAAALNRLEQEQRLRIANKKLIESSTTDMLTGLGNRFALHERLKQEEHRYRRYAGEREIPFSLLFLDMDNFKYYNDTFGHLIGDQILIRFATLLQEVCRDVDFIARYGGDEFIIILPETDRDGAALLLKRLYAELHRVLNFKPAVEELLGHPIRVPDNKLLSFSAGVALYDSGKNEGLETLLSKADKALYHAKEGGKNTYSVFQENGA